MIFFIKKLGRGHFGGGFIVGVINYPNYKQQELKNERKGQVPFF
jgi:hypothetical protein